MKHALTIAIASLSVGIASADTLDDYRRAEQFLPANVGKLIFETQLQPNWIRGSDRFWFRRKAANGTSFILVDPKQRSMRPAFDHARLAAALTTASGTEHRADKLPFDRFELRAGERAIVINVAGTDWQCGLVAYECDKASAAAAIPPGAIHAEDRSRFAYIKEHDLFVRDADGGAEIRVTRDGEPENDYSQPPELITAAISNRILEAPRLPIAFFSPDGTKVLTFKVDLRPLAKVSLVESVPAAAPRLHSYRYPTAGDADIATARPFLFDLKTGARIELDIPPIPVVSTDETLELVSWRSSGSHLYFLVDSRGFGSTTVFEADVRTGKTRPVWVERSDTYVNRNPILRAIGDSGELLWSSERDGWNHLYLIDSHSGQIKRQVTSGEWAVREVVHVDAAARRIYFTAGGREPGRNPYHSHLYRVGLDGGQPELLSPEDGDHRVRFAASGRYFVDTYSRIDAAPVSVVRTSTGKLVQTLQRADISALLASGWNYPESFRAKARDGVTDIYGMIVRPSRFDPARSYPVIDSIYPGPQHTQTPAGFAPESVVQGQAQALAELGFIVVTVDGMGTPLRSRAFREVSYRNLGDAGGLEDHIAALKQLAARYTYMDLSRVGIYGHSGGGYASARAMLLYPDFFKVAVASAGDHELRSYWAEWGERFQGYPIADANYGAQANAPLAGRLQGKLLLAHGTMDDNVHPTATYQLVDALIAANKDFDLLMLPNRNHGLVDLGRGKSAPKELDPYFVRRRWDYFVEHLLGAPPPTNYKIRSAGAE